MLKNICVYSSSSDAISKEFFNAADELGKSIAQNGYTLVYGGGNIGLMGVIAKSVHKSGGKVIGVIPFKLKEYGLAYTEADELIVTKDLRERKAVMEDLADAFVSLPGGFGTLEEALEIITLKQLQFHNKPIVFINTNNFYDNLNNLFEHFYKEKFAKPDSRNIYYFAPDINSTINYLKEYNPIQTQRKWF